MKDGAGELKDFRQFAGKVNIASEEK